MKGEERGWWWNPTMISLVLRFQSPEVYGRWFVSESGYATPDYIN